MNESILEILKKMDMETPATKIMIEKVKRSGILVYHVSISS